MIELFRNIDLVKKGLELLMLNINLLRSFLFGWAFYD